MPDIETYYREWLMDMGCQEEREPETSFEGSNFYLPGGGGSFWIYGQEDLFDIKTHNFNFQRNETLTFITPRCISVSYYESIEGVEIQTGNEVKSGCVMTYIGGGEPYRIRVSRDVPIRSVGIEIWPAYYEKYLKRAYPGETLSVEEEFRHIGITNDFGAMVVLLREIMEFQGTGLAAKLFFESKVSEAISLILTYNRRKEKAEKMGRVTRSDALLLEGVMEYIEGHLDQKMSISRLAREGCMGESKFKQAFKNYSGMTIGHYIRSRRIEKAKEYLAGDSWSIRQAAELVGCHNPGRFSAMFEKQTGMRPSQWRKTCHRLQR